MQENELVSARKPRKIKPDGADGHRGRMFDKFLAAGDGYVLPRDIVEMLLYFAIRVQDTRDTAVHLMEHFGGDIKKLLSAPCEKLTEIAGVGRSSALLLSAVGCMVNRLEDDTSDERKVYSDTAELGELFSAQHERLRHDVTWAAFLDNSLRIINIGRIKDSPLSGNRDDMFSLVSLAAKYHSNILALARMSCEEACYPSSEDFRVAKHISAILSGAGIALREYFIVTPDDNFRVKKMYL